MITIVSIWGCPMSPEKGLVHFGDVIGKPAVELAHGTATPVQKERTTRWAPNKF